MPPKTIDNLGTDVSERYAKDQNTSEPNYIKGANAVVARTEIDVSFPFFPGELDNLLQAQHTHISWALFLPPSLYNEQRKRLFTFQITPTIGPESKWEAKAQKILERLKSLPDEETEKDQKDQKSKKRLGSLEKREKKVLTQFLATIEFLNKLIIEINNKKTQYQKG